MKAIVIKIFIISVILLPCLLHGQECTDFLSSKNCLSNKLEGFNLFRQSASSFVTAGKQVEFNVILMGGRKYFITLCSKERELPVHFIITDSKSNKLLYDNTHDNYINSIGFKLDDIRHIRILAELVNENSGKDKAR